MEGHWSGESDTKGMSRMLEMDKHTVICSRQVNHFSSLEGVSLLFPLTALRISRSHAAYTLAEDERKVLTGREDGGDGGVVRDEGDLQTRDCKQRKF